MEDFFSIDISRHRPVITHNLDNRIIRYVGQSADDPDIGISIIIFYVIGIFVHSNDCDQHENQSQGKDTI